MTTGWVGDFKEGCRQLARIPRIAATKGMRLTGDDAKFILRGQVTSAGLGQKVANTVRVNVYPKGVKVSLQPAASISFKAPHILKSFDEGSLIRPTGGKLFLAIPTDECPYGRGGGHIKPKEAVRRFKKFRFQRAANGTLLMLFEAAQSQDKLNWKRATRERNRNQRRQSGLLVKPRAAQWVAMYVLVPRAQMPRRIDLRGGVAQAAARLPQNIAISWPDEKPGF